MGLHFAATLVNYVFFVKICNNLGGYVYHLFLFFHKRPANQPAIKGVALYHTKFGSPRFSGSESTVRLFVYHANPILRPAILRIGLAACLKDYLQCLSSASFEVTASYVITRQ
jgi:hypothetical protein